MFQKRALLILSLALSFATTPSMASDDPGWELQLEEDGVIVETRRPAEVQYQKYREFQASITLAGSIAQVLAVLQDNDACTRWLFRCEDSYLIEQINATTRTFYQLTSLPFPAKSRDAVFEATIRYESDASVIVALQAKPDLLAKTKHVRIKEAFGSYHLIPVDAQHTRVIWRQYVDPSGALPAWLVNSMLTDLPQRSLIALRKIVLEPPYRQAQLVYDNDNIPNGLIFKSAEAE